MAPRACLLLSLGWVLVSPSLGQDRAGCEPEAVSEERLVLALEDSEGIARVATESCVVYAALCRGAAYAFRLAEPEGESSGELARRGFELAARARGLEPGRVEGHYRYAVCLGIYLRENRLSGIARVGDLMTAARRAAELDGSYDRGGPHRLLARIYAEAPRLVGPGDHDLARTHLARLLQLAGQDDENRLTAVSVHLSLGDEELASGLLAKIDAGRLSLSSLRRERERLERALRD